MRVSGKRFAIVGCGTAGLATAIFLARAGHDVSVYERFSEPAAVGAGILVQPSGAAVLRQLDLLDALERTAGRVEALAGTLADGTRIMDVHYAHYAPNACGFGVHRANLLAVLHAAALNAGVNIHGAHEVSEIERKDSCARLRFADGRESEPFDAVVIANGTQSRLREQLPIRQSCKPYPWGALWAILPIEDNDPLPRALVQRYYRASVMIGLMPTGTSPLTGKPCVSFFWSLKREKLRDWQETSLEDWKREVLSHWPEIDWALQRIESKEQLAFASYADVRMRRWHDDNVVVIGDAAHGMSPQLGQGVNLALLDAFCLSRCIEERESVVDGFAAYTKRRRNHLRFYQFASRWMTPLFQSDSRTAAWIRDWSFPLVNRFGFTRREAVRTVAGLKTGWMLEKSVTQVLGLDDAEELRAKPSGTV